MCISPKVERIEKIRHNRGHNLNRLDNSGGSPDDAGRGHQKSIGFRIVFPLVLLQYKMRVLKSR